MKTFTLNLTEDEILYIRSAICNKNLKHTVKMINCREDGNEDGERYQHERHEIGANLLHTIDGIREAL